jgi:inosine-uridine nucleoside N-ribohydrolase
LVRQAAEPILGSALPCGTRCCAGAAAKEAGRMTFNRLDILKMGVATAMVAAGSKASAAEPGVSDTPLPRYLDNHRIIVDTDPGNDDATAILMALAAPNVRVEAITIAPGNLGPNYDQQVRNALFLVDLSGKSGEISVHAGMSKPMLHRPYPVATFIHGKYGLGSFATPIVKQQVSSEHAVDAIRRIVKRYPGEVVIAALGGLTNVAMALLIEPAIAAQIKGIVFVGGPGSAVPGYNALVDPEAVQVVLNSGAPIMMGLGGPGASTLLKSDFDHIATFNTPLSRFFLESNALRLSFETTARNATGSVNADPLAMAMIIDPSIATGFKAIYAEVELEGEYTRGTILYGDNRYDLRPTPPANVNLCTVASNEAFKTLLFRSLGGS